MINYIACSLLTLLAVFAGFYLARIPPGERPKLPPLPAIGGIVTVDRPSKEPDEDAGSPWR